MEGSPHFVDEVRKELHGFLQKRFDFFVRELFAASLEDPVAKRRHEIRVGKLAHVAVHKIHERVLM